MMPLRRRARPFPSRCKREHRASDHPREDENTDLEQEDDACDGNRKKHGVGG
jgi:hypothetical protein